MNNIQQNTNFKGTYLEENEIDLSTIFRILLRNKSFISIFSITLLIISCIFSLIKRRVWEGQFEIVISQNNKNQLSSNQFLQNFTNLDLLNNSASKTLNTEVGILKWAISQFPLFAQGGLPSKKDEMFESCTTLPKDSVATAAPADT